jgi:RNA recognition motif-containing protein
VGKKLFVRNLGSNVDSSELEDMFNGVGDVESCVVQIDTSSGSPRRVGYVTMASDEGARDGIQRFNGTPKDGMTLIVTEDLPHVPNPTFKATKRRNVPRASDTRAARRST